MDMRKQFEEWAKRETTLSLKTAELTGEYFYVATDEAWKAWQAARAHGVTVPMKRIAEKKLEQMGATVHGVLVRNEAGALACVSEHGRVTWLDDSVMGPAGSQPEQPSAGVVPEGLAKLRDAWRTYEAATSAYNEKVEEARAEPLGDVCVSDEYSAMHEAKLLAIETLGSAADAVDSMLTAAPAAPAVPEDQVVAWVSPLRYGSQVTFQKPEPPEWWSDFADGWYCRPLIYADVAPAVQEPVGFIQSSGINELKAGHPARIYPAGSTPSPFESAALVYTHPTDSGQEK